MKRLIAACAAIATLALSAGNASAHSFNLALVVTLSGPLADQGNRVRNGVIIAAKERDAHADEEADGHLGGLDVYVHTVDGHSGIRAGLETLMSRVPIDIVVVIGAEASINLVRPVITAAETVLLEPGRLPFPSSMQPAAVQSPAVRAFVQAFVRQYGHPPSYQAALGYNAARRIDLAVRALGGVSDKAALQRALAETENGFDW